MRCYMLLLSLFVDLASCCCASDEVPIAICLRYQCFVSRKTCCIEKVDPNYKVKLVINQTEGDRVCIDIQQAENAEENEKIIISCFDQLMKKSPSIYNLFTDEHIPYDEVNKYLHLRDSQESVNHSQLPETQKN